jgi:sugar lactone lactonase YvrE
VVRVVEQTWSLSRAVAVALVAGVSATCSSGQISEVHESELIVASLVTTLGDDENLGSDYIFGSVASVALDQGGRIYVADRSDSRIRVYSRDGALVRAIGREGEGPGEFQIPLDLVVAANGDLWVRDLSRIQRFVPSGRGTIPDSVVRTQTLTGYANTRPVRASARGSLYYYPSYFFPLSGGSRYFYEIFGPHGVIDTLAVPNLSSIGRLRGTSYRQGRLDRYQREIVSSLGLAPFESRPMWQITSRGTLLTSSGADLAVRELTASHDIIRELRLPFARRPVPSAERADSLQALRSRLDDLTVPLADIENVSDFVRQGEVPDSLPTVLGIHEGGDGRIWLQAWPRVSDATDFIAFSPDGTLEGQMRIPMSLGPIPPHFRADQVVAIAVDPITGVERVVLFEFRL